MFKRVLLIAPPSSSYLGAVRPPTGLGYVAQALHESGIEYAVHDMRARHSLSMLRQKIASYEPDLIGLSLVSFEYKRSYELIRDIKKLRPSAATCVGGIHVSVLGETVLEECPDIDFGIVHEGEQAIVQLCRGEAPLDEMQGLLYRHNGEVIAGPPPDSIMDLDSVSFPRYVGFELGRYARERPLITSRGCPYRCIFCPNSIRAKRFRARSAENVVDEIEYWYSRGIRQFNVDDDNFTLIKERVYDICSEIERRGLSGLFIRCANGLRADRVDRDLLARMKEVGFKEVAFGADGGNNRVLQEIVHKGETIEDIEGAITDACDLGLRVKLFIIVGSPGETMSDIEDSIALAQRYPIEWLHMNNPIPYPGTELYEWVRSHDAFVIPPEEYLNGVCETDTTPVFETAELSRETREQILVRCRKIEKMVKRRAVERMFRRLPGINKLAGWLFASRFGQWLFFKNVFARSLINRIWYMKMMRD
ncbi:MAG: radical SAM protein [Chloroflexota bacterium]